MQAWSHELYGAYRCSYRIACHSRISCPEVLAPFTRQCLKWRCFYLLQELTANLDDFPTLCGFRVGPSTALRGCLVSEPRKVSSSVALGAWRLVQTGITELVVPRSKSRKLRRK